MGSCEIYPQTIAHNPNGRFVVVCGDGEYIIYTAMALRNKAFGTAQEFVWAFDSSEYATLENSSTIKVFKNFKERKSFKPEYGAEGEHRLVWFPNGKRENWLWLVWMVALFMPPSASIISSASFLTWKKE